MTLLNKLIIIEITLVIVWIINVIHTIIKNNREVNKISNISSQVMRDIASGKIKRHILTDNTTKEISSKQLLDNYKDFTKTELFKEIIKM